MDKQQLQELFRKRFDHNAWQQVLTDVFGVTEIRHEPRQLENESNDKVDGYEVGWLDTKDGHHIGIYEFEIKSRKDGHHIGIYEFEIKSSHNIQMNRVGLRSFVKGLVKYRDDAALVVFYDKEQWRLSFVCDLRDTKTAPKRFTYALGIATETYRTPAERLAALSGGDITFETIRNAFSVEALSKDFFKGYKDQYAKFCNHISGDEKWERDYVKKMLGRLVFLQFLQKKGWMGVPAANKDWAGGDLHYSQNLIACHKDNDRLLSDILEPLFFETLNKRRNGDLVNPILGKDIRIPYLNGGLFDKDTLDYKEIDFPYDYFSGLMDFFSQYNFTIDENDPYDSEVGIDPEMLGHIFENLLEDNKDKGAFYTPKEIVQYMCRQSLVEYLQSKLGQHPEIDHFIHTNETGNRLDSKNFIVSHAKAIGELLDNVRICDPAIGSGAFPMGLLNEIFHAKMALNMTLDRATVKKNIIQNSIYGVDIEQGAVDIARLRFWLSLVVDENEPQPLPNLDYKIMQGNSLLESFAGMPLDKIDEIHKSVFSTDLFSIDTEINFSEDIDSLMDAYFNTTDHDVKTDLRNRIDNQVKERISYSIKRQLEIKHESIEALKRQLTDNSPQTKYKTIETLEKEYTNLCDKVTQLKHIHGENNLYFLWHTYFKEVFDEGGFDIVIGNPPYIQLQKNGGELSKLYGPQKEGKKIIPSPFQTFDSMGDIYSLFYERGFSVLKPGGVLCFITSKNWMRTGYGENTRKFFVENTNPVLLVDLGAGIFESATVDTNILMFTRDKNRQQTRACILQKGSLKDLSVSIRQSSTVCGFGVDSWVVLSPIEQSIKAKIEAVGTPLRDWDINIYRGVLTGYNEAFIIDGNKKDKLIAEDPKSADIIRPILRGRDIKRYSYEFADLWLINTHNGVKEKGVKPINIDYYPAVKQHLDDYWTQIEKRADQGDTPYNLRNCAYIEDFSKQKIVWKRIGSILRFCFDNENHIVLDSTCFATGKHIEYLTAILNSKFGNYMLQDAPKTGTGDLLISVQAIEPIKIPIPDDDTESQIANLLQEAKYHEIDLLVYGMYNLSSEEIAFIERQ